MNVEIEERIRELLNYQYKKVQRMRTRKEIRDEYCIMIGMLKIARRAEAMTLDEELAVLKMLELKGYQAFDRDAFI